MLKTLPVNVNPVPALYVPAELNCAQMICVVPTVIGALVVQTHPVSAKVDPASTKVNAPGISVPVSKSVERVNINGNETEPTCVTTYIPLNAADSVVVFTYAPTSFFRRTRLPTDGVFPSMLSAPLDELVNVAPTPLDPLLYVYPLPNNDVVDA